MWFFLHLLVPPALAYQFYVGRLLFPRLRKTCLIGSWWFWCLAWGLWVLAWCCSQFTSLNTGLTDQIWYATAVLTAAVPIAVLGARRPGQVTWLFFVLMPLILVLCWPAWVDSLRSWQGQRLSLEEPAIFALGLVIVMGFGNFMATQWRVPMLFMLFSLLCLIAPLSIWGERLQTHADTCRFAAILANTIAALLIAGRLSAENLKNTPAIDANGEFSARKLSAYNRVWRDYLNLYGLAWARRFQERINQIAERDRWPLRLTWSGWVDAASQSGQLSSTGTTLGTTSEQHSHQIDGFDYKLVDEQHYWLLTRFVEKEWLDERLNYPH